MFVSHALSQIQQEHHSIQRVAPAKGIYSLFGVQQLKLVLVFVLMVSISSTLRRICVVFLVTPLASLFPIQTLASRALSQIQQEHHSIQRVAPAKGIYSLSGTN